MSKLRREGSPSSLPPDSPVEREGSIQFTVRRSARARRVRVNVRNHTEVEVVLPRAAAERAAAAAVRELAPWIERRLAEGRRALERVAERGDSVPYLGRSLALVPEPGRARARIDGDRLLVPGGDHRASVERLYRRLARAEVASRLDAAVAVAGLSYTTLSIRSQSTRWASCSATGAMSFNWRLLLAPEPVLDYVVWHEVCHLRVRDHSPRFWEMVDQWCPGWRSQRSWLRAHGPTLVL